MKTYKNRYMNLKKERGHWNLSKAPETTVDRKSRGRASHKNFWMVSWSRRVNRLPFQGKVSQKDVPSLPVSPVTPHRDQNLLTPAPTTDPISRSGSCVIHE